MNGHDVATAMRAIEDNVEGEVKAPSPPLDVVVAALLRIDYDGLALVLDGEAGRVVELLHGWYGEHKVRPTLRNAAALGFVQGVTFAVAARRLEARDL